MDSRLRGKLPQRQPRLSAAPRAGAILRHARARPKLLRRVGVVRACGTSRFHAMWSTPCALRCVASAQWLRCCARQRWPLQQCTAALHCMRRPSQCARDSRQPRSAREAVERCCARQATHYSTECDEGNQSATLRKLARLSSTESSGQSVCRPAALWSAAAHGSAQCSCVSDRSSAVPTAVTHMRGTRSPRAASRGTCGPSARSHRAARAARRAAGRRGRARACRLQCEHQVEWPIEYLL
jgi:hypothetical protein